MKSLLVNMINKIKERSSLKSELVGYLDCLNPITISQRSVQPLLKKLEGCLLEMSENKLFTSQQCDQIEIEYKEFVTHTKSY